MLFYDLLHASHSRISKLRSEMQNFERQRADEGYGRIPCPYWRAFRLHEAPEGTQRGSVKGILCFHLLSTEPLHSALSLKRSSHLRARNSSSRHLKEPKKGREPANHPKEAARDPSNGSFSSSPVDFGLKNSSETT